MNYNSRSSRIASNTVVLFIRMFVLMIINLYSARFVLKGLGELDYGIYNTIAGTITVAGFLGTVLAFATQRFFSIALGKNDRQLFAEVFSVSLNIILVISLVLLVLFETAGIWFVQTQLTIPADRLEPAMWLYQFALFTFVCSYIQVPFIAAIYAHEDMGTYSVISTIDCVCRAVVAVLLCIFVTEGMIFYGAGLLIVSVAVLGMYVIVSSRKYSALKYTTVTQKSLYRNLLFFSGWATIGALAGTVIMQGGAIILNINFGPLINVAFGIAILIYPAFNSFANSLILPFRPAMIKAYAERDYSFVDRTFSAMNKVMWYTLLCVVVPGIFVMDIAIRLWLDTSNPDVIVFARLMFIYSFLSVMHNPITIIVHAIGKVKNYHLCVDGIMLLCLPLSWVLFRMGMPPSSIFAAMITVCVVSHIMRLVCAKRVYPSFSIRNYVCRFLLPAICISLVATAVAYGISNAGFGEYMHFAAQVTLVPMLILLSAYFLVFSNDERTQLRGYCSLILKRKK